MKALVRQFVREDEGQDLVEYAMLLAFIALICITAVKTLGTNVNTFFIDFASLGGATPATPYNITMFTRAADVDMLVVDAPAWADASTLWLAQGSQLTVLPTGTGVDDLNPTIRLMHALMEKGIADWRVALSNAYVIAADS